MILAEPFQIMKRVIIAFNELQIPYFVGGSMASSLYGIPRTTQDADIIADIKEHHISAFTQKIQDKFYADEEMIRDAINREGSFNVIFLEAIFKVDIFVLKSDKYSQNEMARREIYEVSEDNTFSLYLASPEDVIINKLQWYQSGGRSSGRQWNDVLGVIKIRRETLDYSYLEEKAKEFGINDLLKEVIPETNSN